MYADERKRLTAATRQNIERGDDPRLVAKAVWNVLTARARQATVVIQEQKLSVEEGHVGHPDVHVTVDSRTWIGFLRKEKNVVWALLRRKIRLDGPLKLLVAFGKCFPQ